MLLLDTHVLLWWLDDPSSIAGRTRELIADPGTAVFVSAAAAWEITIKRQLGKLDAPDDLEDALERERFQHLPIAMRCPRRGRASADTSFEDALERERFQHLPIAMRHALAVAELPPIHADPFDRIQIAQARLEGLTIVTRDGRIPRYEVPCLRA